jgi:hypothetical protein
MDVRYARCSRGSKGRVRGLASRSNEGAERPLREASDQRCSAPRAVWAVGVLVRWRGVSMWYSKDGRRWYCNGAVDQPSDKVVVRRNRSAQR